MARSPEVVKVIDHVNGSPLKRLGGAVVFGVVAGAGSVVALTRKRPGAVVDLRDDVQASEDGSSRAKAPRTLPPTGAFDLEAVGIDEPEEMNSKKAKILFWAQRHDLRFIGRTMQVFRRYSEIRGSNVAAAVTLQVFVSLFPLFLVTAAVLGFVVHANGSDVIDRIVGGMGLTGEAAETMRETLRTATESRRASSVIGVITLFWSALGVSSALQYAFNQCWQAGNRGMKDKAVGAGWLAGAALLFTGTAALTTAAGWLPAGLSFVTIVLGALLSAALWMFTAKVLPNVQVSWRDLIPGTILGVIGLEILKILGGIWVPKAVESSSALYGTIGIVLAVLAWMLLFGKLVVYSSILNVVMYEAKYGSQETTIELPRPAPTKAGVTRSGTGDTD